MITVYDNSSFETYQSCPRAWFHKIICKREQNTYKSGREFGSLIHRCLDSHYRGESIDIQHKYIDEHFEQNMGQLAPDDHRTHGYAQTLLANYKATYPQEPFVVCTPTEQNIEIAFQLPFATIDGVQVYWSGRIDLIVHYSSLDEYWIVDHKTHFRGGASAFDEYIRSTPQWGYVWAARQLTGKPIKGFVINMIITRSITRTGAGIGFERQRFPVDDDMLDEWYITTHDEIASLIQRQRAHDEITKLALSPNLTPRAFPCRNKNCTNKYGQCEYLDVCRVPASQREMLLYSNLYKDHTWNPIDIS